MFSNRGGSNRVRASGYRRLLQERGFEVLAFEVLDRLPDQEVSRIRPQLDRQFRGLADDDLATLKFRVVARLTP
jgi:hypothetical protein